MTYTDEFVEIKIINLLADEENATKKSAWFGIIIIPCEASSSMEHKASDSTVEGWEISRMIFEPMSSFSPLQA